MTDKAKAAAAEKYARIVATLKKDPDLTISQCRKRFKASPDTVARAFDELGLSRRKPVGSINTRGFAAAVAKHQAVRP